MSDARAPAASRTPAPGPGALRFILGARRRGFLAHIGELWREYGDTFQVRIGGRTLLVVVHPDAVERVLVSERDNYDKRASYDGVRKYLLGQGLVASTGELWRRQRRLMAPFFTPKSVQSYTEMILRDGAQLVERWSGLAKRRAEVEIDHEMAAVTASIILKAMFSAETMESIPPMKEAIGTMISFADAQGGVILPLWLPTAKNRKYRAARALVHRSIDEIIARRRRTDESQWPDDLLTRLMKVRDEQTGQAMSEGLLRDESLTIFVAGHETTATTMTFAWYALAANPGVAERLHEELDRVLGGRSPTANDLRQLPYTLQVIKEVLRLYPPAPFYARDAVDPGELGGFHVPARATVLLSPYYTHRHPDFWEHPERFDPDRWTREREAARHGHAYHPFSGGPRVCIGNNFSLLESQILLAQLAQRFSPRLRAGYRPRWQMRGTLSLTDGLPMTIEPR
jgi:cytochrome P450